jgi:uncharacterized membrane protein YecN with MAPEG domain
MSQLHLTLALFCSWPSLLYNSQLTCSNVSPVVVPAAVVVSLVLEMMMTMNFICFILGKMLTKKRR